MCAGPVGASLLVTHLMNAHFAFENVHPSVPHQLFLSKTDVDRLTKGFRNMYKIKLGRCFVATHSIMKLKKSFFYKNAGPVIYRYIINLHSTRVFVHTKYISKYTSFNNTGKFRTLSRTTYRNLQGTYLRVGNEKKMKHSQSAAPFRYRNNTSRVQHYILLLHTYLLA